MNHLLLIVFLWRFVILTTLHQLCGPRSRLSHYGNSKRDAETVRWTRTQGSLRPGGGGRHAYTCWLCTLKCGSRLDCDEAGNGPFVNDEESRI